MSRPDTLFFFQETEEAERTEEGLEGEETRRRRRGRGRRRRPISLGAVIVAKSVGVGSEAQL